MRISSLFKDKAYSFQERGDPEDDKKFACQVLKKLDAKLEPKNISLLGIYDNFDLFSFYGEENQRMNLKISLSDPEGILKREASSLKNNKCKRIPNFIDYREIKIGETITCLLTQVSPAENIRDYGRSIIFEDFQDFSQAYSEVFNDKRVRRSYNSVIKKFAEDLDPSVFLPKDIIGAFQSYTNYPLCQRLMKNLEAEILEYADKVKKHFKYKCHASISLDSIFYGYDGFYFDFLSDLCMGHPFIDIVDLMLELGLETKDDDRFLKMVCDSLSISFDKDIFDGIYNLQLRKKLAELVTSYIKEVYLYDSFRYDKLFYIADTFAHSYNRFCSIPVFKENRDFIMKTICEPIFGVKA